MKCPTSIRWSLLVVGLLIPGLTGCHLRPNFGPPGTIGEQRAKAIVHDPFPDNDIGPPIASGRPPGFDRPASEPKRLQSDNPYARRAAW